MYVHRSHLHNFKVFFDSAGDCCTMVNSYWRSRSCTQYVVENFHTTFWSWVKNYSIDLSEKLRIWNAARRVCKCYFRRYEIRANNFNYFDCTLVSLIWSFEGHSCEKNKNKKNNGARAPLFSTFVFFFSEKSRYDSQ